MRTTTPAHWSDELARLNACEDAVEWVRTQPDAATAWRACQRGDWLLWIAARLCGLRGSPAHRAVVLAACACARLALPVWIARCPHDRRIADGLATTERWARGEAGVTLRDMQRIRYAAADAASDAARSDATTAASAAACYAASAAAAAAAAADVYSATAAATGAAAAAADAADACYAASAAATAAAVHARTLADCADIVRRLMTSDALARLGACADAVEEVERREAVRAAGQAAQEAAKEAATLAAQAAMRAWIAAHGSTRLRTLLAEGIDCERAYRAEWLAITHAGWQWYSSVCGEVAEPRDTSITDEHRAALGAARATVPAASLQWLEDSKHVAHCDCERGADDEPTLTPHILLYADILLDGEERGIVREIP